MRRSRWMRLLATLGAIALIAGACGDDDDEDAGDVDTGATTTEGAPEDDFDGVTITGGGGENEYAFEIDGEIHASTINVRAVNDGSVAHEFTFAKIGEQSEEDFFAEFAAWESGEGPIPPALFDGVVAPGAAEIQPGDDPIEAEMSMTSGTWLLFCSLDDSDTEGADDDAEAEGGGSGADQPQGRGGATTTTTEAEEGGGREEDEEPQLPPHYESGMFEVIEVEGDPEPTAPEGPVITTVDYGFEGLEALEGGTDVVVGLNSPESEQLHHVEVFALGPGTTAEAAEERFEQEVLQGGDGGGGGDSETQGRGAATTTTAPEGEGEEEGEPETFGTYPLAPGYGTTFTLPLESGHTYLFACFLPDADGSEESSHAHKYRMYQGVTIP